MSEISDKEATDRKSPGVNLCDVDGCVALTHTHRGRWVDGARRAGKCAWWAVMGIICANHAMLKSGAILSSRTNP